MELSSDQWAAWLSFTARAKALLPESAEGHLPTSYVATGFGTFRMVVFGKISCMFTLPDIPCKRCQSSHMSFRPCQMIASSILGIPATREIVSSLRGQEGEGDRFVI